MEPISEKMGKKAVFSAYWWDETTTCYDRAFFIFHNALLWIWLCYSLWLFHLQSVVKIQFFLLFSPWRDPRLRHFAGYPFGTSRKKASTIFYNTAINIMSIPIYRDVYRIFFWRWIPFLNLRRNGALSWLTGSVEFLFTILKNKILSICYGYSCFIFLIWWKYSFYLLFRHWGSYLNFTGYPFGILIKYQSIAMT